MKTRSIVSSLLFFLTTLLVQAAAPLDSIQATVDAARAYIGGDAKLDTVHALQYRGTVTLFQGKDAQGNDQEPLVGQAILSFEKPYSQKIEFIFDKQSLVTGFNGYEGYEYVSFNQEDGEPAVNIRSIGGDELRRNKAAALENLRFFKPFTFDATNVKDKGMTTVDGKKAHQIDFIHNGKFLFSRCFDVSNGDLLQTILDTGMITIETGEMMVDGVRFSNKTVGVLNGETKYEMVFEKIIINPEFPATMFDYPTF